MLPRTHRCSSLKSGLSPAGSQELGIKAAFLRQTLRAELSAPTFSITGDCSYARCRLPVAVELLPLLFNPIELVSARELRRVLELILGDVGTIAMQLLVVY